MCDFIKKKLLYVSCAERDDITVHKQLVVRIFVKNSGEFV